MWARCRDWIDDQRFGRWNPDERLGRRGEQVAARECRRRGLRILSESESDRAGEIDLIAMHVRARTIIFIEVKTFASEKPGHPADRVDEAKQTRLTRAALRYLRRERLLGVNCRFDVIAVWWPKHAARPTRIQHFESAFEATGVDSFFT